MLAAALSPQSDLNILANILSHILTNFNTLKNILSHILENFNTLKLCLISLDERQHTFVRLSAPQLTHLLLKRDSCYARISVITEKRKMLHIGEDG